ncbi:BA14K family protein [Aurantimonas marianensis]|uniref:Lectin-like protein BA14k n=1 Tax=Aurantimonas marianensis TaxID=2920428 RepID=A0A9X2H705_9HYPH|nr:BA14K family protein [Aurantimonas marianensis]MCP3055381.1 BA14K family protein [Aurantimonas marianensis]
MNFFKPLAVKSIALALALSVAPATVPANTPLVGISQAEAGHYGGGSFGGGRHYRGGRYYRGHRGFRGDRRYYRRHRGLGSGGAAIIGLGIGAAIASQPRYYRPAPRYYRAAPRYYRTRPAAWTGEWYRYCAAKYRSFDARSGTFQPYHGRRRLCR